MASKSGVFIVIYPYSNLRGENTLPSLAMARFLSRLLAAVFAPRFFAASPPWPGLKPAARISASLSCAFWIGFATSTLYRR